MKCMEIGQKVRFLNEVGGGTIAGFQGKDVVLVTDSDGFEIPMLKSQVVVIETNANNFERPNPGKTDKQVAKPQVTAPRFLEDGEEDDPADRPVTYTAKPVERRGGDNINVCMAFVPVNVRELSTTNFECYLINDSNYYINVVVASQEETGYRCRWQGIVEPNTKQLLETIDRSQLNDLEHMALSIVSWKEDKTYELKPAVSVQLRIDGVKFYKLHTFQPSPFFREPTLIFDVVRDDKPIRLVEVDAEEVLDAIRGTEPEQPETQEEETVVVVDRQAEREALKAAKRALKAEQNAAKQKERDPHVSQPNRKPKDDVLEVDLHISALLDNTAGLSNSVLLNTQLTEFRTIMERYKAKRGQQIVFIHGKGEGVLRDAIIKELRHRYKFCTYQDASFREYGFGATMVTIH